MLDVFVAGGVRNDAGMRCRMARLPGRDSEGNTPEPTSHKGEARDSSDKGSNPRTHGMENIPLSRETNAAVQFSWLRD